MCEVLDELVGAFEANRTCKNASFVFRAGPVPPVAVARAASGVGATTREGKSEHWFFVFQTLHENIFINIFFKIGGGPPVVDAHPSYQNYYVQNCSKMRPRTCYRKTGNERVPVEFKTWDRSPRVKTGQKWVAAVKRRNAAESRAAATRVRKTASILVVAARPAPPVEKSAAARHCFRARFSLVRSL